MSIHILIVDDDYAMRLLLSATLKTVDLNLEIGCIYEAENGRQGMDILKEHPIDLLLIDLCMPVMDGLEMLRCISEHPEYAHIPAIVISGETDPKKIEELRRDGVEYIHKPLVRMLLSDHIQTALQKRDSKVA